MTRYIVGTKRTHSARKSAKRSARKSARKQTGGNMISVLKTALLPFLFYKAQKTQQRRVIRKKQKTRKLARRRRRR